MADISFLVSGIRYLVSDVRYWYQILGVTYQVLESGIGIPIDWAGVGPELMQLISFQGGHMLPNPRFESEAEKSDGSEFSGSQFGGGHSERMLG